MQRSFPGSILPRLDAVVFILLFFSILLLGPRMLNIDGDLGRHITIGDYIRRNLEIPLQDVFSHTMKGKTVVPHEWIAQLSFSIVHHFMDLTGVVLLTAAVIASTFTLTYREMLRQEIFRMPAFFLTFLAAFASSLHWLTRPHIFTFLFTAIWAYLLENERSKIWAFPLIMLIWANTHGAFIAGFVILGAHLAGWLWEFLHKQAAKEEGIRLLTIGALSLAVTLINPAGWRLWDTSVGYLGNRYLVDRTVEYQSPNFHEAGTWPFLILLALGILALGFGGRMRPHQVFLFAGWTLMSLYSARNIPLFAIVATPCIGFATQGLIRTMGFFQRSEENLERIEKNMKGSLVASLAFILLIILFPPQPANANRFNENVFPVKAVDWLQEHPQEGRMFNFFTWGGYLLYRLWPEQTVFIDGQTDFYGETLTREYSQVLTLEEGWEGILQKYDIAWAVIQPGTPLVEALQEGMGWKTIYQDDTAVILHAAE